MFRVSAQIPCRKQLGTDNRLAGTGRKKDHQSFYLTILYLLKLIRDNFYMITHPEVRNN
jgi:hypothetical protein